jgi:membrane-bound metal-dependent hydrolase YbcI (DUF457 family)
MCWAYVTGKATSSILHIKTNPYLLLFLGILPDIDLLIGVFGIEHRTWTHSVFVWSLMFIPIFIKYRGYGIPYYVSVIQHIILGDSIVGRNMPFWPLSNLNFSLGYNLLSLPNILIEATGLAIFLAGVLVSGDARKYFFETRKSMLLTILPIIPLLAFILFIYSFNLTSDILVDHYVLQPSRLLDSVPSISGHRLFLAVLAMHLILLLFLLVSLFLAIKRSLKQSAVKEGSSTTI